MNYMLFSGNHDYPRGGWRDCRGSFKTFRAALDHQNSYIDIKNNDFAHIVSSTGDVYYLNRPYRIYVGFMSNPIYGKRKQMKSWHLETRRIADLVPHTRNPRTLTKDQARHLQKSLESYGLIDKPIITKDGKIIGGHQRVAILKRMKQKEAECWVCDQDMTDKEVDELNIRLNRNTGEWDYDELANSWDIEDLINWGFDLSELAGIAEVITEDPVDESTESPAISKPDKSIECPKCGHKFSQ